ncbi:MAG: anaerobic ribonucleoside-triphosphate reductase activating protein [Alphaproteobacteria bacterium]|nr:anaerobic ribonucleoside-triphosphate reductase activating protein [Alphaproteobacteria bacterium]
MLTAAGLVPFTTIDFPGRLAAVIFMQGCPLKCPFCHNYTLQKEGTPTDITWPEIDDFLAHRKKQLDGIVLSGGEPLKHKEIKDLILKIKELGYQVAVHTSGVYPDHLVAVLPSLNWVGLDIKAPWDKYNILTGILSPNIVPNIQKSLDILLKSNTPFECRTTCDPRYLTKDDILSIAHGLSGQGVKSYVLQRYRTFDGDKNPPEESAIESFFRDSALQSELKSLFPNYQVR